MLRYLGLFLVLVFTSFFFFPVEFIWFPGFNTKTAMAGVGVVILIVQLSKRRIPILDSGLMSVALWAAAVSFMSFLSITYNDTNDSSFLTYFISMCVWLAAAYLVTSIIRAVHGTISVRLVANYLIAVCVLQCIIAFAINQIPFLDYIVNSIFITGKEGLYKGRIYGIGATLDIAGLRFMAVLTIISYTITRLSESESKAYLKWYIFSFLVIGLIGNMISRSTVLGVILGLLYLIWTSLSGRIKNKNNLFRIWRYSSISITVLVVSAVSLYQINQNFRNSMHFGFEGFFSLYEQGEWEVSSNKSLIWMLKNIKPEKTRTWIIGDGYYDDPNNDPYYTGSQPKGGFYMLTDVGYMRFIFYFGILGTLVFMGYFCQSAYVCTKHFPRYRDMFILILLCNFIGWIKVSTDLFLVFAIFLSLILHNYSEDIETSRFQVEGK